MKLLSLCLLLSTFFYSNIARSSELLFHDTYPVYTENQDDVINAIEHKEYSDRIVYIIHLNPENIFNKPLYSYKLSPAPTEKYRSGKKVFNKSITYEEKSYQCQGLIEARIDKIENKYLEIKAVAFANYKNGEIVQDYKLQTKLSKICEKVLGDEFLLKHESIIELTHMKLYADSSLVHESINDSDRSLFEKMTIINSYSNGNLSSLNQ